MGIGHEKARQIWGSGGLEVLTYDARNRAYKSGSVEGQKGDASDDASDEGPCGFADAQQPRRWSLMRCRSRQLRGLLDLAADLFHGQQWLFVVLCPWPGLIRLL